MPYRFSKSHLITHLFQAQIFSKIQQKYLVNIAAFQEVDSMTERSGPPPINETADLCALMPPSTLNLLISIVLYNIHLLLNLG